MDIALKRIAARIAAWRISAARGKVAEWPAAVSSAELIKGLSHLPDVKFVRHEGTPVIFFNYGHSALKLHVGQNSAGIYWMLFEVHGTKAQEGKFQDRHTSAKNVAMILSYVKRALPHFKPPPPAPPSIEDVTGELRGIRLGPGGRARSVHRDPEGWDIEPSNRERLDHFGNDGGGWDEEGWNESYAEPVHEAATKWLAEAFKPGLFHVDVGDKGHVFVGLTPAGKAHFGGKA